MQPQTPMHPSPSRPFPRLGAAFLRGRVRSLVVGMGLIVALGPLMGLRTDAGHSAELAGAARAIGAKAWPTQKVRTVVIDAGHGGHDGGCKGASNKEKEVTLAIALKLGAYLKAKVPTLKVVYTRTDDHFVELHERAEMANRQAADLFISIHCNSGPKVANGTESYAMGLHKSEANLDVAKRENAVVLLEEEYAENYDGFDPSSPEAHIIFSMYQNAFLTQSLSLASKIETQFKSQQRPSRGVKQAGFLVLYKTRMPSVLVEAGFLTNGKEEEYLASEAGQEAVAASIGKAFVLYQAEAERK